jgi:hypothetical protein
VHKEELRKLYFSPNIIRIVKSRRMRLAGHVARMEKKIAAYRTFAGNPEKKRLLGRPQDVDGSTVIKWILDRMGWYGLD